MGIYFINHEIKIPIEQPGFVAGKRISGDFVAFFFSSIRMSLPDLWEGILKLSSPWRQSS